ncbi:MAG: MFS transporter, partial [Acidimicrobiales bacterium]
MARCAMSAARAIAGVVVALYLAAEGFSAFEIGALFLVVTVMSALMSTGIGLSSDRVGRKPFLVVIPLLAAVSAVVFAVVRAPAMLFLFAALGSFGRGQGAGGGTVGPYQPAESAFVAEGVPTSARAAAFGRLAFASSVGALLGSLLAGLAHTHSHMTHAAAAAEYRPAFVAAGALAALAAVVALWLHEPAHERSSSPGQRPRRPRMSWPRRSWPVLWRLAITNSVNGMGIGLFGP